MVSGSAIIIPSIPINDPQIDKDSKMMAGFRPVIFPHDTRYDESVLNGLYYDEYRKGRCNDNPEVLSGVGSFENCQ